MTDAVQTGGIGASATSEILKYGLVGTLCLVFAWVIIYLYRENRGDRKAMETERKEWMLERETLKAENRTCTEVCKTEKEAMKADYEKRTKENLDGYTHQLIQDRDASRRREDDIRKETAAFLERISEKFKDSNEALIEMLQKFYDRLVK